jgi:hypothetical protein
MLNTNTVVFENTALVAVINYRLTGTDCLIHERYTHEQRDVLQSRIDVLRAYQSKDADGKWIAGKFDKKGVVDYMHISFDKPSVIPKPAFEITYNPTK